MYTAAVNKFTESANGFIDITMHRLTARFLLVLLLVGTFAVALALSAPPPHACCLRKPLQDHGSASPEFQSAGTEHNNCCPPVTTAQWAEMGLGMSTSSSITTSATPFPPASIFNCPGGFGPISTQLRLWFCRR
jgi:hypothetical protein